MGFPEDEEISPLLANLQHFIYSSNMSLLLLLLGNYIATEKENKILVTYSDGLQKSYNPYKCPFMIHMDERFILILKGSCGPQWDAGLNSPESDHLNANHCLLTSTEGRIQGHVRATCGLLTPGKKCVQDCVLDGKRSFQAVLGVP